MIVNLAETASNAMLDTIAGMMSGGSIELLADDSKVLVMLKPSSPAAKTDTDQFLPADDAVGRCARQRSTSTIFATSFLNCSNSVGVLMMPAAMAAARTPFHDTHLGPRPRRRQISLNASWSDSAEK